MKTLAIFIDSLTSSGTELQVKGLIEHLPSDVRPILFTIKPSDSHLIPSGCEHVYLPLTKIFSLSGLKHINVVTQMLKQYKVDIVQCYFPDSTIIGMICARLANVKLKIVCFRDMGFWITSKQKLALKPLYRFADLFIANADVVAKFFANEFQLPHYKFRVIRNGVDPTQLPFKQPREPVAIGILGNMTREVKRIDLFISAAALLKKRYPELSWHVIGDGHLKSQLALQAKQLNVDEKIIFAGRVSPAAEYLKNIDIGIICSDSEGLSNAIIEYMFTGVTVVATSVGGNPELVTHGKTGLLVPPKDAKALASAIESLIQNPDARISMTYKARDFVECEYSWNHCVKSHLEIYNKSI